MSGHLRPLSMLQPTKTMRLLGSGLIGTSSEQKKLNIDLNLLVKLKPYDFTFRISCQDQILR